MTVQNEIPSNSFQSTGDNEFQLDYYVHEIEELLVTLDGAIVNPNLYTIQFGTLQDYNGAKVIFEVPITGTLVITRNTSLERVSSYNNTLNNINASTLNNDFDRLYRIQQEQKLSTNKVNAKADDLQEQIDEEIQDRYDADLAIRGYVASLSLGIAEVDIKLPLLSDVDVGDDSKGKFLTEVESVNGAPDRAFAFVDLALDKEDVGLDNVDNTSDLDKPISTLVQAELDGLIAEDVALNEAVNALANGSTRAYLTYAELDADKATLPTNSFARVTNDPTPANNWLWQWDGTVLTKSARDDLAQAKAYADANRLFKPFVLAAAANFNTLVSEGRTVVPTNEIAAACTNRPSSNAGVLDVALIGSGVFQVYRVFEFDLAYERQKLSDMTWTDWVQSASKDMVDMSAANTLQSAQDYADANPFFKTQTLAAGADLDILPSGNYIIPSDSVAATMTGLPPAFAVPRRGYVFVMREGTTNYMSITRDGYSNEGFERVGNGKWASDPDFAWLAYEPIIKGAQLTALDTSIKAWANTNANFNSRYLTTGEDLNELPAGVYFTSVAVTPTLLNYPYDLVNAGGAAGEGILICYRASNKNTPYQKIIRYTEAGGYLPQVERVSNGGGFGGGGSGAWLPWRKCVSTKDIDDLKAANSVLTTEINGKPNINCFKNTALSNEDAYLHEATLAVDEFGVSVASMDTSKLSSIFYDYDIDGRIFAAGQSITLSASIMTDAVGSSGGDISLIAYKTDGAQTGTTVTRRGATANVWETISVTLVLPTDAVKFRIRFIRRIGNTFVRFKKPILTSTAWDATFISAFGSSDNTVSTISTIYVAKTGNNANTGTKLTPKLTVQAAIDAVIATGNNGCVTFLDSEWYRESVVNSSDLTIELNAVRGKRGTIIGSDRLLATKTSGFTKVYQSALAAKPVGMGGARGAPMIFEWGTPSSAVIDEDVHSLQRGEAYRLPYTVMLEAASKAELDTVGGNGKWWWESGIIYFAATDGSDATLKQYEARVRPCLTHTNGAMVLRRIDSYFSNSYGMAFDGASVVRDDCRAYGAYHNGFSDNANSTMSRRDMALQNGNDGFNGTVTTYTGTPNMDTAINASYFDPYGALNGDDGISYHIRGTCNIWGGLFEYNTKAGVVHVTGGGGNCYGTIARGQVNGFYTATPAPDGRNKSSMHCHNTIAEKNTYDYRSADADLTCIGTMSINPSGFGYYQTGTGKIVARNCLYTGDALKAKSGTVTVINDSVLT